MGENVVHGPYDSEAQVLGQCKSAEEAEQANGRQIVLHIEPVEPMQVEYLYALTFAKQPHWRRHSIEELDMNTDFPQRLREQVLVWILVDW